MLCTATNSKNGIQRMLCTPTLCERSQHRVCAKYCAQRQIRKTGSGKCCAHQHFLDRPSSKYCAHQHCRATTFRKCCAQCRWLIQTEMANLRQPTVLYFAFCCYALCLFYFLAIIFWVVRMIVSVFVNSTMPVRKLPHKTYRRGTDERSGQEKQRLWISNTS